MMTLLDKIKAAVTSTQYTLKEVSDDGGEFVGLYCRASGEMFASFAGTEYALNNPKWYAWKLPELSDNCVEFMGQPSEQREEILEGGTVEFEGKSEDQVIEEIRQECDRFWSLHLACESKQHEAP